MEGNAPFVQVAEDWIFNIVENVDFTAGNGANYAIIVNNGTTEIYGNGNIKSQGGGIGVRNGASVVFNGGNLTVNSTSTSGRYLFYLEGEGSTVTINGGNFDFNENRTLKRAYIYTTEGTTVYVNGGTFGFDPTTWVAEGYKVEQSGEQWIVSAE